MSLLIFSNLLVGGIDWPIIVGKIFEPAQKLPILQKLVSDEFYKSENNEKLFHYATSI